MVVPSVHKEASMMDIPNPEEVLSKTPVKEEDRQMVNQQSNFLCWYIYTSQGATRGKC